MVKYDGFGVPISRQSSQETMQKPTMPSESSMPGRSSHTINEVEDGDIRPVSHGHGVPPVPRVRIAAIDNGLAFPTQHPNRIRSYPYGWLNNPIASRPFSKETAREFLPILSAPDFTTELLGGLEVRFKLDRGYSPQSFAKQKSVLRGQLLNLVAALTATLNGLPVISPVSLHAMPLLLVHQEDQPGRLGKTMEKIAEFKTRIETLGRMALFKSC